MQIQLPANLTAGCCENMGDCAMVWFVLFSHFGTSMDSNTVSLKSVRFLHLSAGAPCIITWVYTTLKHSIVLQGVL